MDQVLLCPQIAVNFKLIDGFGIGIVMKICLLISTLKEV